MDFSKPTQALRYGLRARWGLLAVALLLGALLIGATGSSLLAAGRLSDALARGQGEVLLQAVRNELGPPDEGPPEQEQFNALIEDNAALGLRYVAVVRDGEVLFSSGASGFGAPPEDRGENQLDRIDGLARLVMVPPKGMERGKAGKAPPEGLEGPEPPEGLGHPPEGRGGPPPAHPLTVVEFEPTLAMELEQNAARNFALGLAGASLLTVLAGVFWRISTRAQAAQLQLERQKRLASLGAMSAVLAHELRNPLASLKGNAQLLSERLPEGGRDRRKADRVVSEVLRMERLTNDLLDFVRSGRVERVEVDPARLVKDAAEAVTGAQVELDLDRAPDRWSLDPDRLQQVLINLLQNAARASPEGAAVTASVARGPGGLEICVRDRGEGIPPGQEEAIFEPFHTTRTRGTGLGLAVSRRIIELHGGQITAATHPGGGALFSILIPDH